MSSDGTALEGLHVTGKYRDRSILTYQGSCHNQLVLVLVKQLWSDLIQFLQSIQQTLL